MSEIYPPDLQPLRQWICWRIERRNGKATKIPVNPRTGANASSTDPSTWGAFDEALASMRRLQCAGIGFVFTPIDEYCGVDLDNCINRQTGEVSGRATRIIDRLRSYTALSQSRQGIHIIIRGKLPSGRRQAAFGGLYEAGRFFALTGNLFPGSSPTIEDRQAEIELLHAELFPPPKTPARSVNGTTSPAAALTDAEIIDKMFDARNGADVRRLWEGDTSGYASHSEADLALCSHLACWCGGDTGRIDALFRQSGLHRETKWERADYRDRTIGKALEGAEFYSPTTQSRTVRRKGGFRVYRARNGRPNLRTVSKEEATLCR